MTQNICGSVDRLRGLATALRQQQKQAGGPPKLPAANDQDILRAMLGKRWGARTVAAEKPGGNN